ncbi:MAG: DUF3488 and transglutaminase-like domain-containing protein [Betaproteobacteria bacterium]
MGASSAAWQRLPRQTQDTVFAVAVVACVLAPQAAHLPLWGSLLAAGVLAARLDLALRGGALPGRWWLAALLATSLATTYSSYGTWLGREAGSALIALLLALKTLELRSQRDAFVLFFLGFFSLLTAFFTSQSLPTAIAVALGVMGLLTALVRAHMPVGNPPWRPAVAVAAKLVFLGSPTMLVLFLLFPRVPPLWAVDGEALQARSGLSGTLKMGAIADLALDDSIALRLRFTGAQPARQDLYFRGPVLSQFDGQEWTQAAPAHTNDVPVHTGLVTAGEPIAYEITLEPHHQRWLLAIDASADAPLVAGHLPSQSADLQWQSQEPIDSVVRYQARSYLQFQYGTHASASQLRTYTTLAPGSNPRTVQWADDLLREPGLRNASAMALSDRVLAHLRNGPYRYTLNPGVYGPHAADVFWFDRQAGFCEHIAAAYVVVMRALRVPSRIVTGYQGATPNPLDGFWTVRQSDAHAWAEIWQAGVGWQRVDPTAAISPWRVDQTTRLSAPRSTLVGTLAKVSPQTLASLRAAWEAINNGWTQWVLNYSQSQQWDLMRQLGFSSPNWQDLVSLLTVLAGAAVLGGVGWSQWRRRHQDPWARLQTRLRQRLAQHGFPTAAHQSPRQMAALIEARYGSHAAPVCQWLLRLEHAHYGPNPGEHALDALLAQWKRLPWPGLAHGPGPKTRRTLAQAQPAPQGMGPSAIATQADTTSTSTP